MSDDSNAITPSRVDPARVGKITAAEMMKYEQVPRDLRQPDAPTVIYVKDQRPEYRGDDLLRRFVPYFVITIMALVILGGIAAILGMIIPMVMAAIIALVGSLVSIILGLVVTIIAAVIVALGITWCQTINRRDEMDQE